MPIIWRDQMSVGNDLIDQDHRYLLCLVNSVELAIRHSEDSEDLLSFVAQLVQYTHFHFEREERIQKTVLYPQASSHHDTHQEILAHLRQIELDVSELNQHALGNKLVVGEWEMVTGAVVQLLREWILEHVLKDDKRMEPYLRKLSPTLG